MHTLSSVGFAWNVGNPMYFKVLQCNTDSHNLNMVVQRGVAVPCNWSETGYNSALDPKSDTYFPDVQLEGDPPSKLDTQENQGIADTPNIAIAEGGGKWHKPLNSSLADGAGQSKIDWSTKESKDEVYEGPGTTYYLPTISNKGDSNK